MKKNDLLHFEQKKNLRFSTDKISGPESPHVLPILAWQLNRLVFVQFQAVY